MAISGEEAPQQCEVLHAGLTWLGGLALSSGGFVPALFGLLVLRLVPGTFRQASEAPILRKHVGRFRVFGV